MRSPAALPSWPAPGTTVCEVRSLSLIRGDKQLLHDVNVTVRAGEVLALIGPNGAGKSTLLGVLSGDNAPDGGTVEFYGRPLSSYGLAELSRRRGVLTQEQQLTFPFTALEVVEMGRAPWRRTQAEDEDEARVSEAMNDADVAHLSHRRVPSLSGGERARVAFARVIATNTGMLLLDEPTAALDLGHQEAVLQRARQAAAAGCAVVVVLHDLNLAGAYADRITLLRGGEVVASGTPHEVLTSTTLSSAYDTPVEVFPHPATGEPLVFPQRSARS